MSKQPMIGPALRRRAEAAWGHAHELNVQAIERKLTEVRPVNSLLDAGCGDGATTQRFARAAGAATVTGLEVERAFAERARARGVEVTEADLNEPWPLADGSIEVVVSNQVIEHLTDSQVFVAEIARTLAVGGLAIVSTENLASWHNIAALTLGWEPFSLTNGIGQIPGLGNPLALHRRSDAATGGTMRHTRVFAHRGLRELFEAHHLIVGSIVGSGYYPLPARLGRLDPRHAAFVTVTATKAPATGA
jgi:SAM-dependent methyltransferase